MTANPALDPAVVASLRELTPPGEPDVLTEVLQLFLADVPGRVARLRDACAAGSAADLQRAAHSLKGSAGNIGAHDLYAVCRHLDERGRTGDLAGVSGLVAELETEYARVVTEIQRLIKTEQE